MKKLIAVLIAYTTLCLAGCGGSEQVRVDLDPRLKLLRYDLPVPVQIGAVLSAGRHGAQWLPDMAPARPTFSALRQTQGAEVTSSAVEIHLDPDRRELSASATLQVEGTGAGTQNLEILLSAAAVDSTSCAPMSCTSTYDGTALRLELSQPLAGGQPLTVDVSWHDSGIEQVWGDFPEGGGSILANLLDSPSTYFTFGYSWLPWLNGQQSDVDVDCTVTFPGQRTVVLSGELLEEQSSGGTTTSRWHLKLRPGGAAALALGNYQKVTGRCGSATLELLAMPGTSIDGYPIEPETYVPVMEEFCDHFEKRFGTIPVSTLRMAGVDERFRNGYSAPGLIIVPNYTFDDDGTGSFIERDFFLAHELSHQWWGDAITVSSGADAWLVEGMADWAAGSALERLRDADSGRYIWQWEVRPLVELWRADGREHPLVPPPGTEMEPRIYYIKGAWVLRMLEFELGKDTMDGLIMSVATAHLSAPLATTEFTARAESVSGQDLSWFFEPWLSGTGALGLEARARPEGSDAVVTVTQSSRWSEAPDSFYTTSLELDVATGDRAVRYRQRISGERTELRLALP